MFEKTYVHVKEGKKWLQKHELCTKTLSILRTNESSYYEFSKKRSFKKISYQKGEKEIFFKAGDL